MTLGRHQRLILALAASTLVRAQEPSWNLKLSAFGTIGVVDTSTHAVGFRRASYQPEGVLKNPDWNTDSVFGALASARMGDHLLGTFQVISEYQRDGSNRPVVSWACLTWEPFKDFRVRAGVQGFELAPTVAIPELGYSFLWIRPPVEVFGNSQIQRVKGVQVDQTFEMEGDQSLKVWIYGGKMMDKIPLDHVGLWDERGAPTYGGALIYRSGDFSLRLGQYFVRSVSNQPPPITTLQDGLRYFGALLQDPAPAQAAADMNMKDRRVQRTGLDLTYESGPVRVMGCLYRTSTTSPVSYPTWQGFGTFGYALGSLTPYATFSRLVSSGPVAPNLGSLPLLAQGAAGPQVTTLIQAANQVFAAEAGNLSNVSAGVRWDFASGMDLKFQVDHIHGRGLGDIYYNPNPSGPPAWNGHMTVFSLALDFIVGGGR